MRTSGLRRRSIAEFVEDLKHSVAFFDGIVEDELELGRELETHRIAEVHLEKAGAGFQQLGSLLALKVGADKAEKNDGGLEIAGHPDTIDGEEPHFVHGELASNDLSELPFEQFGDAFKAAAGFHESWR